MAGLMVVSLLALAGVLIYNQRQKLNDDILNNGKIFAQYTSDLFYKEYINDVNNLSKLQPVLTESLNKNTDILEVDLISVDGTFQFIRNYTPQDSSFKTKTGDVIKDKSTLDLIKSDKLSSTDMTLDGNKVTEIIVPIKEVQSSHLFSMRYILSYNSLTERNRQLFIQTFLIILPLILIVILLVFPSSLKVTGPLVDLTNATELIRQGNFDIKVKVPSNDEIGSLSQSFINMTADIKKSRDEIEQYSKTLEKQVSQRTQELGEKVAELEKFNKETIERELKMIELKRELENLKLELGEV